MTIKIRPGSTTDFPQLLELIKELAEFEKAPDKVTNTVEQMQEESPLFHFFLAEDLTEEKAKPIGFALYFFAYYTWVGKSLYLDDLYIKPDYRGQKIGNQLLTNVFEVAQQENCKRIRWQVLDWNKNAIEFYKKRGAEVTEEWLNCDFHQQGIHRFLALPKSQA